MSKTIFVSNRLPVTVSVKRHNISYHESIGGLATGLKSFHESSDSLWVGWPGVASDRLRNEEQKKIEKELNNTYKCHPVYLTEKDIDLYYEGFSNKTIWPLFHYFADKAEYEVKTWEAYKKVNQKFYKNIKPFIEKDTMIWVHDYQLMLLPELIKNDFPTAKIGFFLHIPFPSSEIFRLLVWKKEILTGLLGADLIGFHTYDYVRHFLSSVRRILNINQSFYKIQFNDRVIDVDAFPMGIDYEYFSSKKDIKIDQPKDYKIILSVDRLDYTKGIIERIKAYRAFLIRYPKYRKKVKLHLIVAPSRQSLPTYDALRRDIEKLVSEINGEFGTFEWMPIWYLYQSFNQDDLIKYYKETSILLVTPLRDGMNLIAKEYIASRTDHEGMLIISETAGAASELSEAVLINPNDEMQIAEGIKTALEMNKSEKVDRNKIMHARIKRYNVKFWAKEFMNRLSQVEILDQVTMNKDDMMDKDHILNSFKKAKSSILFLDYDGTLVDFQSTPMQAYPSRKLKNILQKLSQLPHTDVVIISGRDHQTLDRWLGKLNVGLVGDHGLWYKRKDSDWKKTISIDNQWKDRIRHVLEIYVDRMPGSFIEEKTHSIALHYRKCEPEMVAAKMSEIKDALFSIKGTHPIEIQQGHMVLEVKDQRVNKGNATFLFTNQASYDFVLSAGDDVTDEDMFKALNEAHTIKIGYGSTLANHRMLSVKALRSLLEELIKIGGNKK
ncbi:MAG: bifunctional alpha,alpha-trehalose-phosphate synthase (UDP-forming)/trehalose-phosphatase [Acholeplasmataceae bacterium]